PMADKTGRARSNAFSVPPTRKLSSPEPACVLLPVTGASRNSQPPFFAAAASSRTHPTLSVLHSTSSDPFVVAAIAPPLPSHNEREASSSATMLIRIAAPAAALPGDPATFAPSALRGAVFSRLRL